MKVVLSARVEAELDSHFSFGIERFGLRVAERTFHRVRSFLFTSLATYPHIGLYSAERDIYEAVIPRTPFIVLYRIDTAAETLIVVALFHYAQDRWRLE